tara:strand:- start:12031 stop:12204 length:174 start_codon:yes stop_codon:yes gene_type:complete
MKETQMKLKTIIKRIKEKLENIFKSKGGEQKQINYELIEQHRHEMLLKGQMLFPIHY